MESEHLTSELLKKNFSSSFELVNYSIIISHGLIEEAKGGKTFANTNLAVEVMSMLEAESEADE